VTRGYQIREPAGQPGPGAGWARGWGHQLLL